jgi:hypothetical protein
MKRHYQMNDDASLQGSLALPQIVETPHKEIIVPSSSKVRVPSLSSLSLIETPPREIVTSSPLPESGHCPLVPRKKDGSISL